MKPTNFPGANTTFNAPADLEESQCMSIPACLGQVRGGNLDGSHFVVVAWQPSADDIEAIKNGAPVFLSMLGGLSPHFLCTDFKTASYQS